MNRRETQIRNWNIRRLRGAYSLLKQNGAIECLAEIDRILTDLGAEPETVRRDRLIREALDIHGTI